jgi:hypothetical protein
MRRGEVAAVRGNLVRALRLAQQFDDRDLEAGIWNKLADLALKEGRPSVSAALRASSVLLFQTVHSGTAAQLAVAGYQELMRVARLDPAIGDAKAVLALAERTYQKDRGWGVVQAAFGPLDDLEPA